MSFQRASAAKGMFSGLRHSRSPASCEDEEVGQALIQLAVATSAVKSVPPDNDAFGREQNRNVGPQQERARNQCSDTVYTSYEEGTGFNGYERETSDDRKPAALKSFAAELECSEELETPFTQHNSLAEHDREAAEECKPSAQDSGVNELECNEQLDAPFAGFASFEAYERGIAARGTLAAPQNILDPVSSNAELETHFESRVGKNNAKRKRISTMRSPKSRTEDGPGKKETTAFTFDVENREPKYKSKKRKVVEPRRTQNGRRKGQSDSLKQESEVAYENKPRKLNIELLNKQRQRALETLRTASDLVSMETALQLLVNELEAVEGCKPEPTAERFIEQATVAVPYMLHKVLLDLLTKRSPEGPAFSKRSAISISSALVEKVGITSCVDDITEDVMVQLGGLRPVDARRIVPFLQCMGAENIGKSRQIRKKIMEGKPEEPQSRSGKSGSSGEVESERMQRWRKRQKAV